MPIFDYSCPAGHKNEALLLAGDPVEDSITCRCGERATRDTVYQFAIHGVTWSKQDALSATYGEEIKSAKDVAAWEAKHNLAPLSPYEAKVAKETEGHISEKIRKISNEQGVAAAAEKVHEINMCEGMGWTEDRYKKFREDDNAAREIQRSVDTTGLPTPGLAG